jgi:hypothetical protein
MEIVLATGQNVCTLANQHFAESDGDDCATRRKEPETMNFGYHSLWGVLILAGDIWAIINIFQSSASNGKKLIWTLVVVLLPVLGLVLWYFLGPRGGRA